MTTLRKSYAPHFDHAVWSWALSVRNARLTRTMKAATILGSWPAYFCIGLAALVVAGQGNMRMAVLILESFGIGQILRLSANLTIRRSRPPAGNQLMKARFHSFPSGHTAAAALGYGLAALLAWQLNPFVGAMIAVFALAATLIVGASRVYLGVHWITDVLASIAYSAAWIWITINFIH